MSSIKAWFVEKLVMGYIKGFLDKLPLDGYKTILSVLFLLITVASQVLPQYAPILVPIAEMLKPYVNILTDVSIGTMTLGLFHKVLKTKAESTNA